MAPRIPQGEVFWALLSNSKHSGVPEDSKSPTLGVGVSSSHFTQSGVATSIHPSRHPSRSSKFLISKEEEDGTGRGG